MHASTFRSVATRGRELTQSLKEEGLGFVTLWPRVQHSVPGWLGARDARFLYALAHHGPGSGAIVEIGSAWGRSTIFLARGSKQAGRERVYAIDPHTGQATSAQTRPPEEDWSPRRSRGLLSGFRKPGNPRYLQRDYLAEFGSLPGFRHNIHMFGVEEWVMCVLATSHDAAQTLDTGPIRLLYVDGLHTYDAVKTDIADWVPKLVRGGVVVFDDYFKEGVGVRRAVDELLASGTVNPVLRRAGQLVWTIKG
jgi:predicted O-methyltransferase YrrM